MEEGEGRGGPRFINIGYSIILFLLFLNFPRLIFSKPSAFLLPLALFFSYLIIKSNQEALGLGKKAISRVRVCLLILGFFLFFNFIFPLDRVVYAWSPYLSKNAGGNFLYSLGCKNYNLRVRSGGQVCREDQPTANYYYLGNRSNTRLCELQAVSGYCQDPTDINGDGWQFDCTDCSGTIVADCVFNPGANDCEWCDINNGYCIQAPCPQ